MERGGSCEDNGSGKASQILREVEAPDRTLWPPNLMPQFITRKTSLRGAVRPPRCSVSLCRALDVHAGRNDTTCGGWTNYGQTGGGVCLLCLCGDTPAGRKKGKKNCLLPHFSRMLVAVTRGRN